MAILVLLPSNKETSPPAELGEDVCAVMSVTPRSLDEFEEDKNRDRCEEAEAKLNIGGDDLDVHSFTPKDRM